MKLRNGKLKNFREFCEPLIREKVISVLSMVCFADKIKNLKDFLKYFKNETLKRYGIKASCHISVCDVGNEYLRPHWHVFIITDYMDNDTCDKIFKKDKKKSTSTKKKVDGELMNVDCGMIGYCIKKNLYAASSSNRTHSNSRIFDLPKKAKLLLQLKRNKDFLVRTNDIPLIDTKK